MPAPIVLIAEELSPAAVAQLESDFDVRHTDGSDRPSLLAALADAVAVIVRSATRSMRKRWPMPRACRS